MALCAAAFSCVPMSLKTLALIGVGYLALKAWEGDNDPEGRTIGNPNLEVLGNGEMVEADHDADPVDITLTTAELPSRNTDLIPLGLPEFMRGTFAMSSRHGFPSESDRAFRAGSPLGTPSKRWRNG